MYPNFFKLCPDWTNFFYNQDMEQILLSVSETIKESPYFPDEQSIFRCFELTPFLQISVVFIGKQPTACSTGLSYEAEKSHILPIEIQRIYKELENEGYYPTRDGNLEHWAKQGVLLLNTALTAPQDSEKNHYNLWETFFENVLLQLSKKDNVIWVIEKNFPCKKHITNATHLILENDYVVGSNIFKTINRELYKRGIDKISW